MSRFNLGDFLNKEIFSKREFKQFTSGIGTLTGGIIDYAKNMATNMLKLSTNISNWMGSSYFPIILISGAGLIVLFKLKVI